MAEYYLISQLPSLDGLSENTPLPITEERFSELCKGLLSKNAQSEFDRITLLPSRSLEKGNSALINAFNENERNLRLALCKARGEKLKKATDVDEILPASLLQIAKTAVEMESPMEAESFLSSYRLNFLETLRPMDSFSEEYVYYYGLKLKLILRMRQFDTESGKTAYKNIYNSIINRDELEV